MLPAIIRDVLGAIWPHARQSALEDISKVLDQTLFKSNIYGNGSLSNKKAILKPMLAQQEQLQATTRNYPNLFFVRLEASEISIKCQKCAEPFPTDDSPRWATNRPNYYYVKLVRCHSKTCNGAQKFGVPNLGLARNYCRPRLDCQLWVYGHS